MTEEVLRSLARLMQQTAVKQAVQERALRRLMAFVPPAEASAFEQGLRADVGEVMENFSGGIDQPMVDATITFELNALLESLGRARG